MTLTDLIATDADFGSEQSALTAYLNAYNQRPGLDPVAAITDLWLAEARLDILNDVEQRRRYGLAVYNDSVNDTVSRPYWRRILALKQLTLVYRDIDNGEGSNTRLLRREYERKYLEAINGINSIVTGTGTTQSQTFTVRL